MRFETSLSVFLVIKAGFDHLIKVKVVYTKVIVGLQLGGLVFVIPSKLKVLFEAISRLYVIT